LRPTGPILVLLASSLAGRFLLLQEERPADPSPTRAELPDPSSFTREDILPFRPVDPSERALEADAPSWLRVTDPYRPSAEEIRQKLVEWSPTAAALPRMLARAFPDVVADLFLPRAS
jgi:hypothetical protein